MLQKLDWKEYINKNGTIVQIGAYNGVDCENCGMRELILNTDSYECHLIEPLPYVFESLQKNYSTSKNKIVYHNFAIYKTDGTETFYVNPIAVESSFVRNTHLNVTAIPVSTKTLKTFFTENNITEITGLFLDVEGSESELFRQLFEETTVRPDIIRYEWPHCGNLIPYITSFGYTVSEDPYAVYDYICVRNDLLP